MHRQQSSRAAAPSGPRWRHKVAPQLQVAAALRFLMLVQPSATLSSTEPEGLMLSMYPGRGATRGGQRSAASSGLDSCRQTAVGTEQMWRPRCPPAPPSLMWVMCSLSSVTASGWSPGRGRGGSVNSDPSLAVIDSRKHSEPISC